VANKAGYTRFQVQENKNQLKFFNSS